MSSNSSQTDSRLSSQKYFPDGDSSRIHSAPFPWPTHLVGEKGTKIWISAKQIQLKEKRAPNTWYLPLFSKLRIRALWDTSLVILCCLWTKGINHVDALYACSNQFQTGQSFHRLKYESGVKPDLIINMCVHAILFLTRGTLPLATTQACIDACKCSSFYRNSICSWLLITSVLSY